MAKTYITETRTLQMWRRHCKQRQEMDRALDAMATAEFPPGTRVRWVHTFAPDRTPVHREGAVVDSFGDVLRIRIKEGGPTHSIRAHLCDIVKEG